MYYKNFDLPCRTSSKAAPPRNRLAPIFHNHEQTQLQRRRLCNTRIHVQGSNTDARTISAGSGQGHPPIQVRHQGQVMVDLRHQQTQERLGKRPTPESTEPLARKPGEVKSNSQKVTERNQRSSMEILGGEAPKCQPHKRPPRSPSGEQAEGQEGIARYTRQKCIAGEVRAPQGIVLRVYVANPSPIPTGYLPTPTEDISNTFSILSPETVT